MEESSLSHEVALASADLATVASLRAELEAMRRTATSIADERSHIATELFQAQQELNAAQSVIDGLRRSLTAAQTERDTLRALAIDLLNELTVLRMPDESALWKHGGQRLERAYQALSKELL